MARASADRVGVDRSPVPPRLRGAAGRGARGGAGERLRTGRPWSVAGRRRGAPRTGVRGGGAGDDRGASIRARIARIGRGGGTDDRVAGAGARRLRPCFGIRPTDADRRPGPNGRRPRWSAASGDAKTIRAECRDAVDMTAGELAAWLETDEAKAVDQQEADGEESTGGRSGGRIVHLLGTKQGDLDEGDPDAMRKVTGYVHRHLAQRPDGDVEETPWRYSLVSWTQCS